MLVLTAAEALHAFVASCMLRFAWYSVLVCMVKVNQLLPFIIGKSVIIKNGPNQLVSFIFKY